MKSDSFDLVDLVKEIEKGELQIPDFQREWVWSDEQIKSLVESVIRGFPINSIMLLECEANKATKFSYKPIKGVSKTAAPRWLVLDGQQRLTSLFGALSSSQPVKLPNDEERYYYIDMQKAVDSLKNSANVDDMIISVPSDKKTKTLDLSDPDKEYDAGMFPLNKIFSPNVTGWILNYTLRHMNDKSKTELAKDFNTLVIMQCPRYKVVYIELENTTPISLVCKIFEKVNTGGTELTVFELLTAILAAYNYGGGKRINLPNDWQAVQTKFSATPNRSLLEVVSATDFVTALTLLSTYKKSGKKNPSCKREDILNLSGADYLSYRDPIADGFIEAVKFLSDEKVETSKYLPYATQLIPMAAIFAELKFQGKDDAASRNKIRQWYWCGVFGESYRAAQETRYGRDLSEVIDWIVSGNFPRIINETQMTALRLLFLKTRLSAAYKGIMSLIFKHDAKDFFVGSGMGTSAAYAASIDVHHIFPWNYCKLKGIDLAAADSIANRTPILGKTNKMISDSAPSVYIKGIQTALGISGTDVDNFLESHFANAAFCRADDFNSFVVDRAKKILNEIENITGCKISDRDHPNIVRIFGASLA